MSNVSNRFVHWADQAAQRTKAAHPNREEIVVAAGITPSGTVHIGNFREVMTVDLVARALTDQGHTVRFIYSWDDFDVFRKVPVDSPAQDMLQGNLGRSICDVPDPWGEHSSYASHHIAAFESSLAPLGIRPTFIRQHQRYRSGAYAEGIRAALQAQGKIRDILNAARRANNARTMLEDTWLPLAGFCTACGKDTLGFEWDGQWQVHVTCHDCAHASTVDLREGGNLKLPWRVDWPMRWAHEHVCFEPGGKDHSSAGGSFDTAKDIVAEVYGWQAPVYVGYDFVSLKGAGGKFSSSKGNVVTVADCLEIYEPCVLRWLFASTRPNTEFSISFDLDVIKLYEDYDRSVALAYAPATDETNEKKRLSTRRVHELSSLTPLHIQEGDVAPQSVPFRLFGTVLQLFDGDLDRTVDYFYRSQALTDPAARAATMIRGRCVAKWVERFAPDDFRYTIRQTPAVRTLDEALRPTLHAIVALLQACPDPVDEAVLAPQLRDIMQACSDSKAFFGIVYDLLLARDRGPRLATLLAAMGPARALPLLVASTTA